jgi:PAS domain S-box-containing protein
MPLQMAGLTRQSARWATLRSHVGVGLQHIRDFAVVLIDDQGRIASWNRGAEHLLGHSQCEAIGQLHDLLFTEDDRRGGVPQRELDTALATGEARDERWHVRRGGSRFCGATTVTPVHDDRQRLLGFLKVLRDLTAERLAAERLTTSEGRYRLLVSSIKDYAIFMLDAHGRVNYWTPAAERIKGYTAAEIIGQPFATFFMPEERTRQAPERELQAARERGSVEGFGWRVRKDGSCFWAEEIVTAVYDSDGDFVGYSKITRDCTDRHQAELERERLLRDATEANRLKDVFLSTMSHELRTPLHAILGWLQVLRLRHHIPAPVAEGLAVIERNARAQGRLIDDLLDASRIITGKAVVTLQPITFAQPLAAAVETVKVAADQKGVELIVRHDVVEDDITGDPERLQQIIWNLLANAIKFTPAGGSVTVTTSSTDTSLELAVTDTGVGIEPHFLPFVFERFSQADTAPTRQHGGLGLGLSIVKHLVELHRGQVVVESKGVDQGTTVRLTLPRTAHRGPMQTRAGLPTRDGSGIRELSGVRVLVVDDDGDARRMMELALSAQWATVTLAASARDAIAAVRAERPDVVLTDLAMPSEDGFALLTQLRECVGDHVPVVAITAQARIEDRERCLAAGFDAYLAKPIDMNEVIDTIARLAPPRRSSSQTQPTYPLRTPLRAEGDGRDGPSDAAAVRRLYDRAYERLRREYTAMPSLQLTPDQVERLTGVDRDVCQRVLDDLLGSRYLRRGDNGTYARRPE